MLCFNIGSSASKVPARKFYLGISSGMIRNLCFTSRNDQGVNIQQLLSGANFSSLYSRQFVQHQYMFLK